MVVINKNSVSSNTWETMYDLLNTNLVDPKSRAVKWIFGSYPDSSSSKFPGFPIITIESPSAVMKHRSVGRALKEYPIGVTISIYTDWAEHVDNLFDQIMTTIRINELALEQDGLYLDGIDTSNINALDIEGNRVYLKTIVARFKFTAKED